MYKHCKTRKVTEGFTLIELLVVIAIIALLVSILLPSLTLAKELAKRAVCMSNLKNLGPTICMYSQENNDNLPAGYTSWDERYVRWYHVYAPDFGSPGIGSDASSTYFTSNMYGSLYCPSVEEDMWYTYGANISTAVSPSSSNTAFDKVPYVYYSAALGYTRLSRLSLVALSQLLITDCNNTMGVWNPRFSPPSIDHSGDGVSDSSTASGTTPYSGFAPDRHNNGANYLLADFSVASKSFDEWQDALSENGSFLYPAN